MKMRFKCKKCGKVFYFYDREVQAIVSYMTAVQSMWKTLYRRDVHYYGDLRITEIVAVNARCCVMPDIAMTAFIGYEA